MDEQPTSSLTAVAVFGLVLVALVVSGGLLLFTRPEPVEIMIVPPAPTQTPLPTNTPAPYSIYVTGAVAQPQTTVVVPVGSRVGAAIDAAGGALAEADLDRVNLAGLLRDGDQVHVPALGSVDSEIAPGVVDTSETTANALELPTPMGGPVVNVNTASAEALDMLPGVGPAIAARIVAYREENGPFADLQSLTNVSGIGESTIEGFAGQVVFDLP